MTSDTANSPDRKKAKLDPFANVRDYTAPSTGALHATSAAELAEYKSMSAMSMMSAPAVGHLEFWKQKADQLPIMSFIARRFFVCVCELGPIRA